MITETWLSSSIDNSEIIPTGYQLYRCDRTTRGGGVLVAISNSITSRKLLLNPRHAEIVAVELDLRPKLILCCVYVAPASSEVVFIDTLTALRSLPVNCDIVVAGDFNAPDINWNTMSANSCRSNDLCDVFFQLNLVQLVDVVTHIKGNTLDLILCNAQDRILGIFAREVDTSDHYQISFGLQGKSSCGKRAKSATINFNYSQASWMDLDTYLLDVDFSYINFYDNVNGIYDSFVTTVCNACHLFIPVVNVPAYPSPVWFDGEIRHMLKKLKSLRARLWKKWSLSKADKLHELEVLVEQQICISKESYISSLVTSFSTDPKKLFRYLRDLKSPISPNTFLAKSSTVISDPTDVAEAFNSFFNSTFTHSNYVLPDEETLPSPSQTLSEIVFDSSDVFDILMGLDTRKAMGPDKMSPKIIKACSGSLSEPIYSLFRKCLDTCSLPHVWKTHMIIPIPKSKDKATIENYRPISLLCILSKVMESLVYNKIIDFIRPQLSLSQFGFLSNRSSINQLLSCYYRITQAFDDSNDVDVIYLDLRKAFDSVPHNELLYKLWRIGITGPLWQWFKAYLEGRVHYVKYQGCSSSFLPVHSGVPQGSVLGPLLFLIYVNDIPDAMSYSSIYLFADDTKLLKVRKALSDCWKLQVDLDSMDNWSDQWLVMLNALKCSHVSFTLKKSKESFAYYTNGTVISDATSYKDLGVKVCQNLSWSEHIKYLCAKAYSCLHEMKRNLPSSTSPGLRKKIYIALVRSHFVYSSQLWCPLLARDSADLERVQRRASKYILQDYTSSYKQRLVALNLLPLSLWLELLDLMFLVKCLLHPSDNFNILDYVSFVNSASRRATCGKLAYKYTRTSTSRHYYFNRVVRLWNAVPAIDLSKSLASIKARLTEYFWDYFKSTYDLEVRCSHHICCPCPNCHLHPM